ncbi:ribonuclease H-like domain-containing protein [Rhizophagus clarus]|uniref:Ribonuclease H-like domain-containing protein n=1 Tax=Rhizophagus clarus TaxID=94130 RepID=A0A8H3KW55_9GLOM|nr:ribonuclease H-like domain-containing protein [Rhizophagus clarus]
MTSSEPSENPRKGRHFTEVWNGHMIKGVQRTRGHYAAICSYCNFYWKDGKPHVLREHLANHCRKCPQEVSLQFAKIVGNEIAENEEDDESDSELITKKQRLNDGQTSIRSFYKNKELEKGYSDEIHRSITKAFVMCNIPFSIIENPWFIDLIKTLQPGYDPPSRQVLSGTLLESETSRVNIRIMNELSADNNFTIAMDGWTDPHGNSLWAFMLMTGSRKEYLLSLEDLSNIRHTGEHLSNVIEEVINKVGAKKFVAIVSDNGSNVAAAHEVKYIVRCANILTKYFKNSTLGSSWLNEAIKSKNIEGGGLKTYVETRWTTVYECVHSVWRLKDALQHVLENHEHEISNQAIKTILKKRGFFDDVRVISEILKPIKEAILMLERTYTTLADCYLYLLRIATFFKQMPVNDYRSLKNSCIKAFNERYKEFDEDIYLLAFFLHPQYKGAGIHNTQFERIQKTALNIWKNLGYKKTSGLELKAQLRKYLDQDNPYSALYSNNDGPFQWWNLIIDGRSSLSRLAKIVFSITPHSASCERLFSALGWMFGKRRTNLNVQTIECMSKIYTHNIHSLSNSKRSLNHIGNSISNDDVQKMIDNLFEEGDILNENEDEEEEYEEPPNIQKESVDEMLNIEQVIDLGPWVYIESSEIPFMFNNKYDSDNDDDWNPEEIV